MPIPKYDELVNPLLAAMKSLGGTASVDEQEQTVARALNLSPVDCAEIHRGTRTKLNYSLAWARNYLKRLGVIQSSARGTWTLTEMGHAREHIEEHELRQLDNESATTESLLDGLDLGRPEEFGEYPIDSVLIRQETRTVFEIVRRIRDGKFILDPDFQRDFIWNLDKQSKLIESTLLRIPLPVIYLAEREDGKTVVVDGLQRLTTFKRYLGNEFALRNLEIGGQLDGTKFSELPPKLQNRIEDAQLILYLIDPKVPEQAKLDIFERVNGGVPLSRQQMRNSIYMGPATRWLKSEAEQNDFLLATGHSLSRSTMRDRECINRFCAFELLGEGSYTRGDMDTFLADALKRMNRMETADLSLLSGRFQLSMRNNFTIFSRHAFRKHTNPEDRRSVINVALFDVFSVLLCRTPETEAAAQAQSIRRSFYHLLGQPEFADAISLSTNSSVKVQTRFRLARETLRPILANVDHINA